MTKVIHKIAFFVKILYTKKHIKNIPMLNTLNSVNKITAKQFGRTKADTGRTAFYFVDKN